MEAARRLKELDVDMYYHLLRYKDKYIEEFKDIFGDKGFNELSGTSIILWMGFVSGKVYDETQKLMDQIGHL